MVIIQKNIVSIFLVTALLSVLIFLGIKKELINLEWVHLLRYYVLLIMIGSLIIVFVRYYKHSDWLTLIYILLCTLLIQFFILSVFVLKVSDVVFWQKNNPNVSEFLVFSEEMYGWNYILAIPYLIILILEVCISFSRTKTLS
ncbi:hypothetical protein CAP35_07265 [Chitinophagaceae bacterium IBVUCB1]|nr:hypothetical protein CAP35_07265 [Chitinophagaceae bacterium IBVUCB1]